MISAGLTASEAAKIIGISTPQVRLLIRRGKIRARKVRSKNNQYGYEYSITRAEARKYARSDRTPGPKPG